MLVLLLVVIASLPYLNILANGFVYDDDTQVLMNPYIRGFRHLKAIFTTTVWSFAGGARGRTNYYRPVMTMGYLLCHAVFGYRAWAFHLISLALNVGVVCLLFVVTRRLFTDRVVAFATAAVFALHPIHTEAVDWIAAVTDLELAFFFLLAFWLYLRLENTAGFRAVLTEAGAALSFVLALLSKEPAAVFPLLATIYEHALRPDRAATSWRVKLIRYGLLWLLLAVYVWLRTHLLGSFAAVVHRPQMQFDGVMLSAVALVGEYLGEMLWPAHLSAYHLFPRDLAALLPRILTGTLALAACTAIAVYLWQRERWLAFGFIWFFATLAPVLNARWMPPNVLAERYLYLPSAGLCWIAGWLLCRLWRGAARAEAAPPVPSEPPRLRLPSLLRRGSKGGSATLQRRAALATVFVAATVLCVARIVTRNRDWKNDLTFYTATLATSPRAATMHNNLGVYYWQIGDWKDAGTQWEEALALRPGGTWVLDNLGLLRIRQKRYREAVVFFRRALAQQPKDVDAYTGLGDAYRKMHMLPQAEQAFQAAVRLAPLDAKAQLRLGDLYFNEGKFELAKRHYLASIRSVPTLSAYLGLAVVADVRGKIAEVERDLKAARKLAPSDSRPYFLLGNLYSTSGRKAQAIHEYEAGLKLDPNARNARAALAKLRGQSGEGPAP